MTKYKRPWLFCLVYVMFGISFCHDPAAEARAEGESDLRAPLIQSLPLDHVPELHWSDSKFVHWVFKLLKLFIDQVHYVLLGLRRVCEVLVVMVAPQVIIVGEDHRFDVAGDAQHAVLFETQERLLIFTTAFTPDSIVEVNLELGPSG